MCNCNKNKVKPANKWVLVTAQGSQYFGSRLEADAARAANGGQGTISRL